MVNVAVRALGPLDPDAMTHAQLRACLGGGLCLVARSRAELARRVRAAAPGDLRGVVEPQNGGGVRLDAARPMEIAPRPSALRRDQWQDYLLTLARAAGLASWGGLESGSAEGTPGDADSFLARAIGPAFSDASAARETRPGVHALLTAGGAGGGPLLLTAADTRALAADLAALRVDSDLHEPLARGVAEAARRGWAVQVLALSATAAAPLS